eukprot:XP_016664041.1 PREDICTED: uncharacterized protein LOC107885106 [Acyrthosiphon pisum]
MLKNPRSPPQVLNEEVTVVQNDMKKVKLIDLKNEGNRESNTPEIMDGDSDSEYLGGDYDYGLDDVDHTVQSPEEVYEDVISELGRKLASKFVSGIQQYISTIIVPSGVGGVQNCLREMDRLIERYPPNHFYIIARRAHSHRPYLRIHGTNL